MHLRNIILSGEKKQVTQDRIEYGTTFLKLKKQSKFSNILRDAYVNNKKKLVFVFCKDWNPGHISGSQLLLQWRWWIEGKRAVDDAKMLGKVYFSGWEASSRAFITRMLQVFFYMCIK